MAYTSLFLSVTNCLTNSKLTAEFFTNFIYLNELHFMQVKKFQMS